MVEINKEKFSKEILDRLSKLQELPKIGFLCGGAVANTILSIIDGKEYPINDLDIFNFNYEMGYSNAPLRTPADFEVAVDRYENRILIPNVNKYTYRIIKTTYDNLINYVYVNISEFSDLTLKEKYNIILDSFDINCCKAGIDLANNELYLNDDFLKFILNRQLLCVNPVTPAHTVIRIIKKRDELNAYLNKDEVFKFLSQFYFYDKNVVFKDRNISIFFGKKYKDLFHKYEEEIKEYFDLQTYAKIRKHYSNSNRIEFEKNSKFTSNYDEKISVPSWVYSIDMFSNGSMHKWYEIKLWSLFPKKFTKLDEEIEKYLKPGFGGNPLILKKLWRLIYNQNKKQKNKSLKLLQNEELYPFVIANDNFHDCDFSEINIEKLSKFISENPMFGDLISLCKLNFQESEKLMNMVKKLFHEELNLFCELISKELSDEKYFNRNFINKKILDQEYIVNKYTMVKNMLSKELIDKMDISDFEYKNIFKELVSPLDLLWGGKFMHNCLKNNENGFTHRIESGEIKVFIISDDKQRTALQISKTNSNTYKIDQIYGHSNGPVCSKHKMIADYLISFLEYKHYLDESEKIINEFIKNKNSFIETIDNSDYNVVENKKSSNIMLREIARQNVVPVERDLIAVPTYLGVTVQELDERDIVPYENDEFED